MEEASYLDPFTALTALYPHWFQSFATGGAVVRDALDGKKS